MVEGEEKREEEGRGGQVEKSGLLMPREVWDWMVGGRWIWRRTRVVEEGLGSSQLWVGRQGLGWRDVFWCNTGRGGPLGGEE